MLNFENLINHIKELDNNNKKVTEEKNKALNLEEIEAIKYISDIKENSYKMIENIIEEKRKTLIIAPMKCGKSTFSFKELYPVLRGCNYHFIFVSPKTSLLEQIESEYRVNSCYDGANATISNLPIVVTPDSLYKVVGALEEIQKPFIICYDEVHEAELNYKHRHKLNRPFNSYEHELCMGLIGLTATADNIIKSLKWDKIYRIKPTEMFRQTPYTNIFTGLGNSMEDIATHILKTIKVNDCPIVVRVNDKKKIDAVKTILEASGIKDVNSWYRSNSSEDDNKLYSEMLSKIHCDFNVLLTTSLVDVGVELFPMRKPIVIDFMDYNSRIIENIQFIGRFREGVKGYHIILPISEKEEEFYSYEEIREDIVKSMEIQMYVHNTLWTKVKKEFDGLKVEYDQLNKTYSYSLDEWGINATVFEIYIKQIVNDKHKLKRFLEEHFTFNSEVVRTVHLPEDYTNLEEIKSLVEEVKEVNKAKKLEFKEELQEFIEWLEYTGELEFKILTTKPDDIQVSDKWVLDDIEDMYNFYWSEDMAKNRKHYYTLQDFEQQGYTQKELLLKALNTKWYNNYKKRCKFIEANLMFDGKKETLKLDPKLRKTKSMVYTLRQLIIKIKGCEKGIKLSNKFMTELYELCILKSIFADMKFNTFTKLFDLIYNVTPNRNREITSIKTCVKLD